MRPGSLFERYRKCASPAATAPATATRSTAELGADGEGERSRGDAGDPGRGGSADADRRVQAAAGALTAELVAVSEGLCQARRGFGATERRVVLGDGAAWIWNLADEHFPGAVEGACKTLVGSRLKRGGMHWSVNGADAIRALRSCSNRLDDFWLPRAAVK